MKLLFFRHLQNLTVEFGNVILTSVDEPVTQGNIVATWCIIGLMLCSLNFEFIGLYCAKIHLLMNNSFCRKSHPQKCVLFSISGVCSTMAAQQRAVIGQAVKLRPSQLGSEAQRLSSRKKIGGRQWWRRERGGKKWLYSLFPLNHLQVRLGWWPWGFNARFQHSTLK